MAHLLADNPADITAFGYNFSIRLPRVFALNKSAWHIEHNDLRVATILSDPVSNGQLL